jgi:hypothetical protein
VLDLALVCGCSIVDHINLPVVQKAHGHRIFVFLFVFHHFLLLSGVRMCFPSVRS